MDILKRNIAPISQKAWDEIDARAKDVLTTTLSARKVLNVNGPYGWNYLAVPEGRLEIFETEKEDTVKSGVYQLKNLIEARRTFVLKKWELDNIERGAKDIDLSALEEAAEDIALFEENAIYNGNANANITGLAEAAQHTLSFGENGNTILTAIGKAKVHLLSAFAKGPYDLIVSPKAYEQINQLYQGGALHRQIQNLIGGEVVLSKVVDGALLIPSRHEDLEFTVGHDFSIGYESNDTESIKLFISESFTLRILDDQIIVKFNVQ